MDGILKRKRSIFIAYPWDTLVKSMYSQVIYKLKENWDIRYGSEVKKANNDSSEREKFLSRNKQLYDKFVDGIKKSDVFIADVSNANPNVMLELGIAIQLNKNIIILTSQDPSRLPFDIKGFEVDKYSNSDDVLMIIGRQLSMFLKIKQQNFENFIKECYTKVDKLEFGNGVNLLQVVLPEKTKNIRIRAEYKIIDASNPLDWIGFHLRGSISEGFSELVYVREDKSLEHVTMGISSTPSGGIAQKNPSLKTDDGFSKIEIVLEENRLFAVTSEKVLNDDSIQLEAFGNIWIQINAHHQDKSERDRLKAEVRNVEILNLDTVTDVS